MCCAVRFLPSLLFISHKVTARWLCTYLQAVQQPFWHHDLVSSSSAQRVSSLRGAAAIQYVNSQYIRITIANSPLCYMTVYFLYSGLRNSTIIYCNETSLDLTSQICLLHRSLEIGCFSSAKWGVMLTPRPFIQCISYFFSSQLWRNYSLIFISFNLLSTYFH